MVYVTKKDYTLCAAFNSVFTGLFLSGNLQLENLSTEVNKGEENRYYTEPCMLEEY